MTLADLLNLLDAPRRQGDQYVTRCTSPKHPDRRPSLVITERGGRILVHCRSQHCRPEDILRPLGLRLADLFVDGPPRRPNLQIERKRPEAPLLAARRDILAAARRQAWARSGVLPMYALAERLRFADRLQAHATRLGDTAEGWEAAAQAAALVTEAWIAYDGGAA